MKILHTSDWHIGHSLYGRKRYEQFDRFFDWLLETIAEKNVDALLVAGDIFDSTTPANKAQALYYDFLCRVGRAGCSQVVITGGNHDSPTFLQAPAPLLKAINVDVIGAARDVIDEEIVLLKGRTGRPETIVCAVPYLRDRDIRMVNENESVEDKQVQLFVGIKNHYHSIAAHAAQLQKKYGGIPVVGMGHLFAAGGKTIDGDGVRQLYVGALSHMGIDIFPDLFSYVALGHLHIPQKVAGKENIRYSGAPLPMGFNEADQKKQVLLLDFEKPDWQVEEIGVPVFRRLCRIKGDVKEITGKIDRLKEEKSSAWIEIEYTGKRAAHDIRNKVAGWIEGTALEVLSIKNRQALVRAADINLQQEETLADLSPDDVFERLLQAREIDPEQRGQLWQTYRETVNRMREADLMAQ